jgi:putative SOS response-associated peptidase YedK
MATFGIRPPYERDETFPAGDIFPTGKKTPFYGAVIVKDGDDRRLERMEWGVPTQVPSKRDPAVKLTKYVTNVRNLSSSFWRSMLTTPTRRCLVPVTSFSEYGLAPGEDGKKPLHWFDVPSRPIFLRWHMAADRARQRLWLLNNGAKRDCGAYPPQSDAGVTTRRRLRTLAP